MINAIRDLLTLRYSYENPLDQRRAINLLGVNAVLFCIWIVWAVGAGLNALTEDTQSAGYVVGAAFLAAPVMIGAVYWNVQTGALTRGSVFFVAALYPLSVFPLADELYANTTLIILVTTVAAGVLLGRRGLFTALFADAVILIIVALNQNTLTDPSLTTPADAVAEELATILAIFAALGLLLTTLGAERREARDIVADSRHANDGFQKINKFLARAAGYDPDIFYTEMLKFIRDDLGFHFAQLFFVNDDGELSRRVRTGLGSIGGRSDIRIQLGDANALIYALRTGEIVLVDRDSQEIAHSHFLPSTQYGLALPLVDKSSATAVLDIQESNRSFTDLHVAVLSTLVQQAVATVRNYQTISALRERIDEQTADVDNLRLEVQRYKRLEQQTTADVWDTYIADRGEDRIGFDLDADTRIIAPSTEMQPLIDDADLDDIVAKKEADGYTIQAPIRIGDQTLGVMTFKSPTDEPPTERHRSMIRQVSERLATALENKRLYEQSQAQAYRERKASEVASSLLTATDIDTALELAASNFNEALGAVHTRIHIRPDALSASVEDQSASNGGGGS